MSILWHRFHKWYFITFSIFAKTAIRCKNGTWNFTLYFTINKTHLRFWNDFRDVTHFFLTIGSFGLLHIHLYTTRGKYKAWPIQAVIFNLHSFWFLILHFSPICVTVCQDCTGEASYTTVITNRKIFFD